MIITFSSIRFTCKSIKSPKIVTAFDNCLRPSSRLSLISSSSANVLMDLDSSSYESRYLFHKMFYLIELFIKGGNEGRGEEHTHTHTYLANFRVQFEKPEHKSIKCLSVKLIRSVKIFKRSSFVCKKFNFPRRNIFNSLLRDFNSRRLEILFYSD